MPDPETGVENPDEQLRVLIAEHLPVGVYRADAQGVLTYVNQALVKHLGYRSGEEILGLDFATLFSDRPEAEQMVIRATAHESLREPVTLRHRDGSFIQTHCTSVVFFSDGHFAGHGGFMEDQRREEQTDGFLDEIPVGFYVVESRGDQDVIVQCNGEFARIHDAPSREAILGRDAKTFHYSAEELRHHIANLHAAAAEGGAVLGERFRLRTMAGAVKTIEINARPHVRDGRIVGRTGAMVDVTAEVEMRDTIDTFSSDMGAIFHTFRHTLTQLKHTIAGVERVLAGTLQPTRIAATPEEIEQAVRGPLHELIVAVQELVNAATQAHDNPPLSQRQVARLLKLSGIMQSVVANVPKPHWRDTWQNGAVEIEGICRKIRPQTLAKSVYRPVMNAAQNVSRITALATLSIARETLEAVDAPIISLREFVTSSVRTGEPPKLCRLGDCVGDAINNLTGFADARKVRIAFEDLVMANVHGARFELTRAINNLLHNAIKYSWQREDGKTWVHVSVSKSHGRAEVSVENWGVPIPAEEIEHGLVFRLGYRGRLSADRGRVGTGVGLTDSLRVARAHRGNLRIESRPASSTGDPRNYTQPFLTTATLELPLVER